MDDRTAKPIWFVLVVYLLSSIFVDAQDNTRHRLPTTRRRLPTVIITREHLRRQQQQRSPALYGPIGDTAAEFIVSAGLDTGKSSAVRIRKFGSPQDNANATSDTSLNEVSRRHPVVNGPHQRRQPEFHPPISIHSRNNAPPERTAYGGQQHTIVNSGGLDLRSRPGLHPQVIQNRPNNNQPHIVISPGGTNQKPPELHPQIFHRRQDMLNERRRVSVYPQRFYSTVDVNLSKGLQQYVPPIFVPNYQQNRNEQTNLRRPATDSRGSAESTTNENSDDGLRTSSVSSEVELHVKHDTASDEFVHDLPLFSSSEERSAGSNKDPVPKTNNDEKKEDVKRPQPSHKHIVAETPILRLKPEDVKNYLIRRPSLVLRDQITVNELSQTSDRPRYGPRALQHDQESSTGSRRKRRAASLYSLAHVELKRTSGIKNTSDEKIEFKKQNISSKQSDAANNTEILSTPLKVWGEFRNRGQRVSKNYPFRLNIENEESHVFQSNFSENSDSRFDLKTPYYSNEYVSDQSSESSAESGDDDREDVMSFSEFLASPIAEKIRLERQQMFRNTSQWNDGNPPKDLNSTLGLESVMHNASAPLLQNIIAARLLHGILNLRNSSNVTEMDPDRTNSRSSPDSISSAEQRQFGIVVSPYQNMETVGSRSTMPIIRILRGKIVPLPDLPQELIPILMGTYKPTQMSETSIDDPKLTENILDNAILSLLQSEEAMVGRPSVNIKMRPYAPRYNRKSPSTNYVGSLKASEPQVVRTKYSFSQPNEWSLGPRCDRLTEEICLDDSDYPSSAIMSSIYKDKVKFDLMYAEVKVRESQVEGLSRQQEQAYSFDHYYGSASSNQDPRDYGPSGGFVCPSEVHYGRPHRAKNRRGEWKVVVNVGEYTQTLRMEKCLASGNPCKYVVAHMQSTCAQVYSYHRLLVFNKDNGLHIDLFRVPTGCTCHLRSGQHTHQSTYSEPVPFVHRPNHYEEFGGHVETAPMPQTMSEVSSNVEKRPSSFGSTLWAILGGGQQAGALAQQPQFLDEVQKQIGWTKQMKQHPHLLKQISPNQVLKQLLDIDDDDEYNVRRLRIRTKPYEHGSNAGGYASHPIPISIPVPPPPPPPRVIARRPVVSAATSDRFGRPPNPKVITISTTSDQPTKIFSLTKDGGNSVRISEVGQQANHAGSRNSEADQQQSSSNFQHVKAYKIRPGMYHPSSSSGETMQFSEGSLVPVAPHFSSEGGSEPGLKPVLRPMKNSDKRIRVEDTDLIAIEKSEDGEIHAFKVETVTKDSSDEDEKINFSYHPILEYLNL